MESQKSVESPTFVTVKSKFKKARFLAESDDYDIRSNSKFKKSHRFDTV